MVDFNRDRSISFSLDIFLLGSSFHDTALAGTIAAQWYNVSMLKQILRFFRLKKIVVATGGGFDPLHEGHIRLFKEAKKLGDVLVVMLNSDEQLLKKKGNTFYPSETERKEIVESIKCVDKVIIDPGKDITCEEALKIIKPDILAKGGDRVAISMPEIELNVCQELGCKIVYNVGGEKVQSSSWLLKRIKGN